MDDARTFALSRALSDAALRGVGKTELVDTFCRGLRAGGVSLLRCFIGFDTLHPVIEGFGYEWRPAGEAVVATQWDRATSMEQQDAWLSSPLHRVLTDRSRMLRRTVGTTYRAGEFPRLDELVGEGATDYCCWVIVFADRIAASADDGFYASLATDRPGGFTDEEVRQIDLLMSGLALAMRAALLTHIIETLMSVYLGGDPGRRVLHGQIERGATETLPAVIWFSDLRGFTRIGDTEPEALLALLNDYCDCLVTAVHDHAGQVLKFIGDGLLAIFPIDAADGDGEACRRALAAYDQARRDGAALNLRRSEAGVPVTTFSLGLHVGEVLYGNVGSATRLDFTVVGPAVNEVSRIGGLCRALEQEVIVSQAFAARCEGHRLASLGLHSLRGVSRPQELFTVSPADAAMPRDVPIGATPATK